MGPRPAVSLYHRPVPHDLADETVPGSPEPWQLVAAVRPDTPHVRALRVLDLLGETFAGIAIIAGGAVLTALATLL